ncbi:MAG: protein-glutamate O-methyltransferase CheR, partial [Actinomycetia bacterium]|nr:protein-glutamate O-methyltransferase CheR [Actinomycetes bacterium]
MRVAEGTDSIDPVRQAVADRLGLYIYDSNIAELSEWIRKRMPVVGCASQSDYAALVRGDSDELRVLAESLTVGESYFFREGAQLDAVVQDVLPALQTRPGSGVVNILCAGCSSGQEAYTLAMRIREDFPVLPLSVTAVDLNRTSIATAKAASYREWSLRGVSDERRERWFVKSSSGFGPIKEIRELVSFEQRNLVDADPSFWSPGRFDIIFCRNVLMYFTREAAKGVIARMAYSLRPGGHLLLGHSEHLRGLSHDFTLCHRGEAFYYALKMPDFAAGAGPASIPKDPTRPRPTPLKAPRPPRQPRPPAPTRTLISQQKRNADSSLKDSVLEMAPELDELSLDNSLLAPALEAFRAEQYENAKEEFARLPLEVRSGPGPQLLEATILT